METAAHNTKLWALLSVRNFSKALERHYDQMKQIEGSLGMINKNAKEIIESYATKEDFEKWTYTVQEVNDSIYSIDEVLLLLQDKIGAKDKEDSVLFWEKFDQYERKLLEATRRSEDLGYEFLPESEHKHWQKDICNFEKTIVDLIVSHIEACKAELKLIEKYTPKKMNGVTKLIIDHIPDDFTFEEVSKYEKDYLRALEDFKNEFSPQKNLWDKFLDILAGGTHQSPSERIMMQRWLEGDKRDL